MEKLKQIACKAVDDKAAELNNIAVTIGEYKEVAFEEFQSHDLLVDVLKKEGFKVEESTPLGTSFVAKYGNQKGINIGVLCEYDALPEIGHACGHNLIAETGIGAALGTDNHFIIILTRKISHKI